MKTLVSSTLNMTIVVRILRSRNPALVLEEGVKLIMPAELQRCLKAGIVRWEQPVIPADFCVIFRCRK
jgi:hypothetical protein